MYQLAQIPLGQPIHFVPCSLEEVKARADQQRYLEQLAWRLSDEIDLNADLGEGCASDSALPQLVSSANIACGFHAGDAVLMQQCVREALKNGVAIGAHPSFPDRENFGRTAMQLPPETVYAQVLYQIGALAAIVHAQGASCGTSNRMACCTTRRRKSRLGQTRYRSCGARCRRRPGAGWAGGQRVIRAGQHYR